MKNLKIIKKNLAKYALVGTLVLTGASLTGCGKKTEAPELSFIESYVETNDMNKMLITEYDQKEKKVLLNPLDNNNYDDISKDIVVEIQPDENDSKTGIVYTYFCYGYQAGKKCNTMQEAINIDPRFQGNEQFKEGYKQGKLDDTFAKALQENRQYIEITIEHENDKEINYYPVEELTVVSYEDCNAIVRNYDEQAVQAGTYQDLLGKDMSSYTGWEYQAQSLQEFTKNHYEEVTDAEYIAVGDRNIIPQISNKNFIKGNVNTTGKKTK